MLKPELHTFEIGPELFTRLRPLILRTLWEQAERSGLSTLSISRAKELLALAEPDLRQMIQIGGPKLDGAMLLPVKTISEALHEALAVSAGFFRREGAQAFRDAQRVEDAETRATQLWTVLFDRRLNQWLRERGHLTAPESIESIDMVVEGLRTWVADFSRRLGPGKEISPAAFFLDAESDLDASLELDGRKIRFRGRPDALILDPSSEWPEIIEYKLGAQGQFELQVAQTVLYVALVNAAKGSKSDRARIQFFRITGATPPDVAEEVAEPEKAASGSSRKQADKTGQKPATGFPPAVVEAFAGYVGNDAAVRRLKIQCSVALKAQPLRMPVNLMLCGPGGLGKTELARRVANAVKLPFVDVPASTIGSVDEFLKRVRSTLQTAGVEPEEAGSDSGLPRYRYPALVVFMDEIHLLKKPDQFLNLLEPKERRAVGSKEVGDFADATFIGATTDKGLLRGPFRSRFDTIDLEPYSAEEVAQILAPQFAESLTVDQPFLLALADMSRRNPRDALRKAQEFKTHHVFDPNAYSPTLDGLLQLAKETWNVDERGLNNADREYLRALHSGPRGFTSLAQILPVGEDEIQTIIEPYLRQLGLVNITSKGRELTELGKRLVSAL